MVYCTACACEVDAEVDDANGFSCCVQCGRVLEDTAFSADITFAKDAGGESTVMGQFVNEAGVARGIGRIHGGRVYAYQADSHEKAQQRGRHDIAHLVDMLSVRPREESVEAAHRLYKIALQRGFTRGRRTNQVAAACLYLICRQDAKPFLLIDFSDALQVNVFTLGAVFLQLAKLLRITEHPMFAKPVDPSLYIHRFADRLDFGRQMHGVANTALRLVASMKRDWIQTGRRPSGICGAAIYIAAHIHGFERSIRDVVAVVHIGEHTLSKRLYEFSSTSASTFTATEFEQRAKQIDDQEKSRLEAALPTDAPTGLLEASGCEHLRLGEAHFALAMCRPCYLDFMQSSGGVDRPGADPPAFERNRRRESTELLALPEPEEEVEEQDGLAGRGGRQRGGEDGEGFDDEEQGIAEAMAALHDSQLQPFAKFLPDSAEEVAATTKPAAPPASLQRPAGRAVRRRGAARAAVEGEVEEQQQQNSRGGSPDSQQQQQQQQEHEGEQQQVGKRQRKGDVGTEAGPAVGPSQVSDQTAARATAAAAGASAGTAGTADGAAAAAGSGGSLAHSQHSDQTAAARPPAAAGSEEDEERQGAQEEVAVGPGAIVTVPQPRQMQAAGGEGEEEEGEEAGDDTLSDIGDSDIDMYLADEAEVKCKEEIWNMMNKDWLEKQAAKAAAKEAAEQAVAEQQAAQDAAEAAGVAYKRGRGRPVGSKTKNFKAQELADLPPAESAQEAAMRMLDHRKLSNKINYNALADLFADDGGGGGAAPGELPELTAEAMEGEEDVGGRGRAVTEAMQQRQAQQEEEARQREARQQANLEAERRSMGGRRIGGLGLGAGGAAGGASTLGARSGLGGGLRRAGGLGGLRDGNFRSQMTSSGLSGSQAGKKGRSVRFSGDE
ncbi:Transcription factor IIIB subunit [Chlorella vulgaris]